MLEKILITGGSGFIGSQAVRTLLSLNYQVFNLDKLTYASSKESLSNFESDLYTFHKGDIFDEKIISGLIDKINPDFILNFAAESHVDRSIEDADDFINTNIIGTYNLLKHSLKYYSKLSSSKKKKFKFIHISTDEVFGSLSSDEHAFKEDSSYRPNSPYSASKASSDMIVRSWIKTYQFPAIITHSSNNYGPWQFPEKLIPKSVISALNEQPIAIYGDGSNIRDWIYVKDNVDAIIALMKSGVVGQSYNIGGKTEISNLDIIKKICKILDEIKPKSSGKYEDLIVFVEDRPGHDFRYALNIDKIFESINWTPMTNIDVGLKESIEWMIDNYSWLMERNRDNRRLGLKKM